MFVAKAWQASKLLLFLFYLFSQISLHHLAMKTAVATIANISTKKKKVESFPLYTMRT